MLENLPIPKKTFFFLVLLLFLIIFLYFFSNQVTPDVGLKPTPTPSVDQVPRQGDIGVYEQQQKALEQTPLIDYTPYRTVDFGLTYIGPLHLKITLWAKDKLQAKEKALAWIKEKGVDPNTHQITWDPPLEEISPAPEPAL